MRFNLDRHHRRSIRLPGYDYSQPGAYFVTIVTQAREALFGEVVEGQMLLSTYGEIVQGEWLRTSQIRREIEQDEFIVMPNHLHGIVVIREGEPVGAHGHAPLHRAPRSLGTLVGGFKSAVTRRINEIRHTPRVLVWQRNYYEHVIRGERDLAAVRQYIADNPAKWARDPENVGSDPQPSALRK